MSQKVHAKSLRVGRFINSEEAWYAENNYSSLWAKALATRSIISPLLEKGLLFRASKAPSKRRRKKSVFTFCYLWKKQFGTKSYLFPLVANFPRKGIVGKYFPIQAIRNRNKNKKRLQK